MMQEISNYGDNDHDFHIESDSSSSSSGIEEH